MGKKNILVVCPEPFYPIKMGSHVRMYNIVKSLHKNHDVDVVSRVPSKEYFKLDYIEKIEDICKKYYPILSPNKKSYIHRIYYKIVYASKQYRQLPSQLYYNSLPELRKRISGIANSKKYDIIFTHYWYSNSFYSELVYKPLFTLDTINVNFKKFEFHLKSKGKFEKNVEELKKYKELELEYTNLNDILISVSETDYQFFKNTYPK
jgi:hypothetical protein